MHFFLKLDVFQDFQKALREGHVNFHKALYITIVQAHCLFEFSQQLLSHCD